MTTFSGTHSPTDEQIVALLSLGRSDRETDIHAVQYEQRSAETFTFHAVETDNGRRTRAWIIEPSGLIWRTTIGVLI